MKRNGYIDVIKFIFALIVMDFHMETGVFLGGRLVVEGFFMISGFLMMKTIEREGELTQNLGVATVKFIFKKYKALFYFLLPSAVIAFVIVSITYNYDSSDIVRRTGLLFFEIFPMNALGFEGSYPIGISWYLSAMFVSMLILYPICKRLDKIATHIICPIIVLFGYGSLSLFFQSLEVNYQLLPNTFIKTSIIRGLAGCALGCILYEVNKLLSNKTPTKGARALFTVLEVLSFGYFLYGMHYRHTSPHDYLVTFVIFVFLTIGISGISYTYYLWNPKWTRLLGTASILVVLTHCSWARFFAEKLGKGYVKTGKIWWCYLSIAGTCVVVYILSVLLKKLFKRLGTIRLWENKS